MMLTVENAHEYEGKYLDSSQHLFHYYPLFVMNHKTFGWVYIDKNFVLQKITDVGIYFESVIDGKDVESYEYSRNIQNLAKPC